VEDLDREVLTLFTEDRLQVLPNDFTRTVVRVDDAVPDFEIDVDELDLDFLQVDFFANGGSPWLAG
jgi:hypothetical protein